MSDWNPDLYMRFQSERTQPSIDLIARIQSVTPKSIIDIGCGPGNSTQVLANRWPDAKITGLDNSPAMIQKARTEYPDQEWIVANISLFEPESQYNIVFSNAALQWVPDHRKLLQRFHHMLTRGGLVAVQIPLFWDMPLGQLINAAAEARQWKAQMAGVSDLFTFHNPSFYYDHLTECFRAVEMWITDYIHVLDSHTAMLEMMRSTGLKPYLERLSSESDITAFEGEVLKGIQSAYVTQMDGRVLLPFKRLFFIAYKSL